MTPKPPNPYRPARRAEVAADAVIAAYIHEISERHRPAEPTSDESVAASAED